MDFFKAARFLIYLIPLGIVIVTPSTLFPFIVGKYVWFRTLSALALIFFLIGITRDREGSVYLKRLKELVRSPLAIAVTAFTTLYVLAGFTGIDPHLSFWSNFERGEGGLQILHLWVFFILSVTLLRTPKEWLALLKTSVAGAVLMILYGIGAGLNYAGIAEFKNFIGVPFGERFQGSVGNSAYVAVYLLFGAFFTALLIRAEKIKKKKWFLAGIVALCAVFFVLAATRGAMVGLVLGLCFTLVFIAVRAKQWRKWVVGTFIVLAVLLGTLYMLKGTPAVQKLPFARLLDISFSATTFRHRLAAWDIAWKGFLERPVLGWGPGNYIHLFSRIHHPAFFDVESGNYGAWFDRAHSIFFDYLAESGAVGLTAFISIFAALGWRIWRAPKEKSAGGARLPERQESSDTGVRALALGVMVAYLIQGLVLFNVLAIYLPLITFLAWNESRFNRKLSVNT